MGTSQSVNKHAALDRYVDEEGVVTLKGRVAATIQSSDELVLTELIFNSGFKVRPHSRHNCLVSYRVHHAHTMLKGQAYLGCQECANDVSQQGQKNTKHQTSP